LGITQFLLAKHPDLIGLRMLEIPIWMTYIVDIFHWKMPLKPLKLPSSAVHISNPLLLTLKSCHGHSCFTCSHSIASFSVSLLHWSCNIYSIHVHQCGPHLTVLSVLGTIPLTPPLRFPDQLLLFFFFMSGSMWVLSLYSVWT